MFKIRSYTDLICLSGLLIAVANLFGFIVVFHKDECIGTPIQDNRFLFDFYDKVPNKHTAQQLLSQIEPLAFEDDRPFEPGAALATNLFYNGSHFVLFQDDSTSRNISVEELIQENEQFPFVILPSSEAPKQYATFKNITWILLWQEPSFNGHYYHFLEYLLAVWAVFDVHMNRLYPNHSDLNEWVEHIILGPKVNITEWLKKNHTINEFITNAVAPKATVYMNNLPFESLQTEWIKFEKTFIIERKAAARRVQESTLSVTYNRLTTWAMGQDPQVFERFKKLVVNKAISDTQPPLQVKNKPKVLYITRQGIGHRSLTNDSHSKLVNILEEKLQDKINFKVVKMEDYNPQEQIQISSNADIMIGVHGNGLTHALWMQKGGLVIELFPQGACQFHFQWISIVSSQKYSGVSGNIVFPSFTKVVREPCLTMQMTGKTHQVFDLNVTLVHQILLRHLSSRGKVVLLSCSQVLSD
jgi:hypothetical protein